MTRADEALLFTVCRKVGMVRRSDVSTGISTPSMPVGLPAPLHVHVPSDLAYVRPVRKMLEALLLAQGWPGDDVDDAALIITEIVQNAVEHGSRADGEEMIRVALHALPDAIEIEVLDPGTGQDPQLAVDRDVAQPVPLEEARGRGLFLIFRLAQQLDRSVADSGGLRVRARKEAGTS